RQRRQHDERVDHHGHDHHDGGRETGRRVDRRRERGAERRNRSRDGQQGRPRGPRRQVGRRGRDTSPRLRPEGERGGRGDRGGPVGGQHPRPVRGGARIAQCPDRRSDRSMILAHGIGGVRDLPVPESFFFTTAAIVLVVSFVLLGLLWKRPLLERHAGGRRLPAGLSAVLLSGPLRLVLQVISVALFALTLATASFGTTVELLNWAPTFVYVVFWLGIPLLSILFGNVWRALSPWRALADWSVWVLESTGREARPVLEWTDRWGRYPAAGALFSFVALELANPRPAYPRTLAIAIALYSYWALAGMAVYGRDAWTRHGEGFAVAFEFLSRIAAFAVREGRVVLRWPFTGLWGPERGRGALVFVAVMLGSTSFDGFERTSMWQNLINDVRIDLAGSPQRTVDLATM